MGKNADRKMDQLAETMRSLLPKENSRSEVTPGNEQITNPSLSVAVSLSSSCTSPLMRTSLAFALMVAIQSGLAGMFIVSTVCLKGGMSHFVLTTYRHLIATVAIAPFAWFFERTTRPHMTVSIFLKIILLGFLGPVIEINLYYLALKLTTASYVSGLLNALSAVTFILALIFRQEHVHLKKLTSQVKILATLATVGGAVLMALYKGPIIGHGAIVTSSSSGGLNYGLGTISLMGCCIGYAGFFIAQSWILSAYPAELSLTTLLCFVGSLEGVVVTFVFDRNMKAWAIGFDSHLFAAAYSGVIGSAFTFYVQGLVNKARGPVFVAAFFPLTTVITTVLGYAFLHEKLYVGSVLGAAIIILSIYALVWAKGKDRDEAAEGGEDKESVV